MFCVKCRCIIRVPMHWLRANNLWISMYFSFFCPTSIEFSAWILRNARSTLGRYAHTVGLMSPSVTCILLMRMRPVTRCPGVCNWQRAHRVHESWLSTATISARRDFRSSFPPRACSDDRGDMKIRFTPVPYSGRDSSWGGTSLHEPSWRRHSSKIHAIAFSI